MIERELLIGECRSWLETPWRHNQCVKGSGVDCVRFLSAIADTFNINHGELPKHYDRLVQDNKIVDHLRIYFEEKSEIALGDILVFKFIGVPHHVAIATDKGMIHASLIHEKVVEHPIDSRYQRIMVGIFGGY